MPGRDQPKTAENKNCGLRIDFAVLCHILAEYRKIKMVIINRRSYAAYKYSAGKSY